MKERFDLTPVALYARVSSDRQDVDLWSNYWGKVT